MLAYLVTGSTGQAQAFPWVQQARHWAGWSERGRAGVSHGAHPIWQIVLQPLGEVERPGERH